MRRPSLAPRSVVLASALAAAACGGGASGPHGHGGQLFWSLTCGDPVCHGHSAHPGVGQCTTERAGDACAADGATCDPLDGCNRLLECADHDVGAGPCPISRRSAKKDIHYLDAGELKRLHDDLLQYRLAMYEYRAPEAAGRPHLGFIIDDVEPSPAVDPQRDVVDLYGYASMAVAAVQQQDAEIRALQAQIDDLRREVSACRDRPPHEVQAPPAR